MTFEEFCEGYSILPNLVKHLEDVASLTHLISEPWIGKDKPFDDQEALKAALLHDVGNMAKSRPETLSRYLTVEPQELEIWKARLKDFQAEYGTDDHQVTDKLLALIGVSKNIRTAIQSKSFGNIIENTNSDKWLLKLISYADLRINPGGVVSLEDRLTYIKKRYPKYSTRPDFEEMCNSARALERQIRDSTRFDLSTLNDDLLKATAQELNLKKIEL